MKREKNIAEGTPQKDKSGRALIILSIIAVLLVIAVLTVLAHRYFPDLTGFLAKADAKYPGIYYLKDDKLIFQKNSKKDPVRIDDDVMDKWSESENYGWYRGVFQLSDDGKTIFYATDCKNGSEWSFTLNYTSAIGRDTGGRISDDISSYTVLKNNRVIYLRTDGSLYITDLNNDEKISRDVETYYYDESEKNILWIDKDSNLYAQRMDLKKDREKIDKDVSHVCCVSDGLSKIVYTKRSDESGMDVYLIKDLEDKEKIAGNCSDYCAYIIDNKVYAYFTLQDESSDLKLMDLIEDDFPDDATMEEPREEDYITYKTIDGFFGQMTREEVDDKYYDEKAIYDEKLERDSLRETLKNLSVGVSTVTLYYYSEGDEEEKIAEDVVSNGYMNYNFRLSGDIPVILYDHVDVDSIEKILLSDYSEGRASSEDIVSNIYKTMTANIARGTETARIDFGDMIPYDARIFDEKNGQITVLAVDNINNDQTGVVTGDLYTVSARKEDLGKVHRMDSDVARVMHTGDGKVYYLKDYDPDTYSGILKVNGKEIDDEVFSIYLDQNTDVGFMYYTDYDFDEASGTLRIYDDGNDIKVSDDVYDVHVFDKDKIVMLTVYDPEKNVGELKIFNGKDTSKMASDVSAIVY